MNVPQTKINIIAVIKEAATLITGTKWPIFKRILLVGILATAVAMTFTCILLLNKNLSSTGRLLLDFSARLIMVYISIKILIPASIIAVRRALGLTIDLNIIKTECAKARSKLGVLILLLVLITSTTGIMMQLI